MSQAKFVVVPPQDVERARALIRSLTYELGFIRVDAVAVAAIPDPVDVRVEVDGVNYLSLVALIEMTLSLAAVMPKHVVHAAGLQEIIKRRRLPRSCAGELQPHLRDGFRALWCEPDPETCAVTIETLSPPPHAAKCSAPECGRCSVAFPSTS